VQRCRGWLVFKAHRLWVSLNSRLESNKEEKKKDWHRNGTDGVMGKDGQIPFEV